MDRITVTGITQNYFNMPVWLGNHLGFFAEENLEVYLEPLNSTEEVTRRVQIGEAQIARNIIEDVIIDKESGGSLIAIAGNLNRLPFFLIARPEIKSFEDMRGKLVGVSSMRAGTSSLIMKVFESRGLHYPADYRIEAVGPILRRWEMLQSGEIDAGLQGAPMNFVAVDAGYTNLLSPQKEYPEFVFATFNVDTNWAQANRGIVVRFLRAILRAYKSFYTDRESAVRVSMIESGIDRDLAERTYDAYALAEVFPLDGDISTAGVAALIEASAEIRTLPKRAFTGPDDYIDRSYLFEARASLA